MLGEILDKSTEGIISWLGMFKRLFLDHNHDGLNSLKIDDSFGFHKIYIDSSGVTITGADNEKTIFTQTITGGILKTNNAIRFKIYIKEFDSDADAGNVLKLKFGTTTLVELTFTGVTEDDRVGIIEGILVANGATNAQKAMLDFMISNSTADDAKMMHVYASGTATEDSTNSLPLTVTWEFNGSRCV